MSTDASVRAPAPAPAGWQSRRRRLRVLQAAGWTLIAVGSVLLLYVVYSLFFTNYRTEAAQRELLVEFQADIHAAGTAFGSRPAAPDADDGDSGDPQGAGEPGEAATAREPARPAPVALGDAVAAIEFHRPGAPEAPPVRAGPLLVVEGVTREALTRGPGHYPETALPGQAGNFAVAGHRTTYGAPFFRLDDLVPGDEVHVTDRAGTVHVYRVTEQRIVAPSAVEVLGRDPTGSGAPTLTLTTCHPRFSAAQRMVVFAELVA